MSVMLRLSRWCATLLVLASGLAMGVADLGMAQTRISNTASVSYDAGGERRIVRSNTDVIEVGSRKRPTSLSFRLLPPTFALSGMRCDVTAEGPRFTPAPISPETLAAAPPLASLDVTTPLILVLNAPGANRDPMMREVEPIEVQAGNRMSIIKLTETGPDSGVFAGGLPASGTFPELSTCDLTLVRNAQLTLRYYETENSFGSTASTLVDPAGLVFDSTTGALVDGAIVTLLDETGAPARVFGDDGISVYPATVITGATVRDASGREYRGVHGRYRFPFAAPGRYRLRVLPPGDYTAPSVASPAALALLRTPAGEPFIINPGSFGGEITLVDEPIFSDIPLDRAEAASLLLTKTAAVRQAAPGDVVRYDLRVTSRAAGPVRAITVRDWLPRGLRYRPGSVRGAGEPEIASDGRTLAFPVASLAPSASADFSYQVDVEPAAPVGEALNRARAIGDGVGSNEAAASVRLQALLMTDAFTIIGRVTEGQCGDPVSGRKGVPGIRLLMEDGTFTVTDREGLYHFEGVRAGGHVVQIDPNSTPVTHTPVACDSDTRQAGNATSRFVEAQGGLLKRVDFQLAPTGIKAAAADALPVTPVDDAIAAGSRDWLAGQKPGVEWLFPAIDHNPRAPAVRVAIKHAPGQRVALTVNGRATEPLAFDGTDTGRGVAISRWSGLPIEPGENRLVARVLEADGRVAQELTRSVHFSGAPVRATFDPAHSRLIADGLTSPLIAVRVTDAHNRPARAGTLVPFSVDQPFEARIEAELQQGRQLAGRERSAVVARVVGDDGIAFLALQPTTQAGAVQATVVLSEEREERRSPIRAWLTGAADKWVVVGFGRGSLGYDMLRARARPPAAGERNRVVADGQLALYAKGRVKGSWLMTIAYDSDRRYDPERGLLGTIDPDRYYTVYGDGSSQRYDAATRRKLYLRLERREFYALFGDFETGLTNTRLMRYSRTLNGAKAAYEGRTVQAAAFAAPVDSRYARDELQGNGLSGPYRLSGQDIVPNSDKLRIEVRDRFRPELIRSSRMLTRHIDYDIDTGAGTIRFREPVLSRDAANNPVIIIVDYEVDGGITGKMVAGGRVGTRLADGRVELGGTLLRDESAGNATVAGLDARLRVGESTEVRAELASGGRAGLGRDLAYLAEVEHHTAGLDLTAYVRSQELGFGVGQQNLIEAGTRRIGLDGRVALGSRLSLTGTGWYQEQLDGPARRAAADVRLDYRGDRGTAFVGAQIADDTGLDGDGRRSVLLTLGGRRSFLDGAIELGGQTQVAPGGDKSSIDFPVRHQITAAWRVKPGIRLIGGYEIASGEDFKANTAQVGFDVAPWTGAKLMTTLNQQAIGENGGRTYAQYGLSQSLPLGRRWTVDATLDANSTISGRVPEGGRVNAFQPIASGGLLEGGRVDAGFIATTLGATYRAERWSWTGRIEYRDGDVSERLGLTSSFLRTLGEGKTLAAGLRAFRLVDANGAAATSASADVAIAWRPLDSDWSILDRLQLRHDAAEGGTAALNALGVPARVLGGQETTRLVNDLALNYRSGGEGAGHRVEATLHYGAKYVRGRYADEAYDGFIHVAGFELRRDLGSRADIGIAGTVQHAWSQKAVSFSGGPSLGVSPARDLWVTAGFNILGYRDRDFEADRYTRAGPYLTARFKFDQHSLGAATRALFGKR